MKEKNKDSSSFNNVVEFQKNMFNPGHYIGTGRVPPTVSAPGNALPLAIVCFVFAAFFLMLGLLFLLSDVHFTSSGLIKSDVANKIISAVIMFVISLFGWILGFAYLRKTKKCRKEKNSAKCKQSQAVDDDEIWQLICPKCEKSHNVEHSKCPYCGFDYHNA